jgi:hypothetical protein
MTHEELVLRVVLTVSIALVVTVIVVWFRNPSGWVDVFLLVGLLLTAALLVLVMLA